MMLNPTLRARGSGAPGTGSSGNTQGVPSVASFADLPAASSVDVGTVYYVRTQTGTLLLGTRRADGLYASTGTAWKATASTLIANAVDAQWVVTRTDGLEYVLWEKGTDWAVRRLSDETWGRRATNTQQTDADAAWTARASLTYGA